MVDAQDDEPSPELAAKIKFDVPHSARIWNYWMCGKDNYEVDRVAGDAWIAVNPEIVNETSLGCSSRAARYAISSTTPPARATARSVASMKDPPTWVGTVFSVSSDRNALSHLVRAEEAQRCPA